MKYLYDAIHGMCEIPELAQKFIYTYEFQRLRQLRQLGLSSFVFPSAEHSRFSHSIGVGHIARQVGIHLASMYPDLVSERFIDLIQVAGLTHDIGHGPMSHAFDKFIENSRNEKMKKHENRSKEIVRYMVHKYKIQLTPDEVNFICETFDPSKVNDCKFEYQIISNTVDVDRLDYILRDSANTGIPIAFNKHQIYLFIKCMRIDNNKKLIYTAKADQFIHDILQSRQHLQNRVYLHKKSIFIEDILKEVFSTVVFVKEYNLVESINRIEDFLKLDDSIIQKIYQDPRTDCVRGLLEDIYSGNFANENER